MFEFLSSLTLFTSFKFSNGVALNKPSCVCLIPLLNRIHKILKKLNNINITLQGCQWKQARTNV